MRREGERQKIMSRQINRKVREKNEINKIKER